MASKKTPSKASAAARSPRVFVSYSHDSEELQQKVLELVQQLRSDGINALMDMFVTHPSQGWPLWCEQQLKPEAADFVLMVGTKSYWERVENDEPGRTGLGVFWEGRIIRSYVYAKEGNNRFISIYFDSKDASAIPRGLSELAHFHLTDFSLQKKTDYSRLLRHLTGQPDVKPAELGMPKKMPPSSGGKKKAAAGSHKVLRLKSQPKMPVKWTFADAMPASPQTPEAEAAGTAITRTGTVLVADVADFSERFKTNHRATIFNAIWTFVRDNPILKNFDGQVYCDNMLDGAVVAFDREVYHEAVELASAWIKAVENVLPNTKVLLRVGIGVGTFHLVPRVPNGAGVAHLNPHLEFIPVSKDINDADRLARIAGSDVRGFAVLSESFLRKFEEHGLDEPFSALGPALFPKLEFKAFQKQAKHGHTQEFRVLNVYDNTEQKPTGIKEYLRLEDLIKQQLCELAEGFWELACLDLDKDQPDAALRKAHHSKDKLRVSLFCPDPRPQKNALACTTFRHLDWVPSPSEAQLTKALTEYPLDSDFEHGPVGAAFHQRRPIAIRGLPEVVRDKKTGQIKTASLDKYLAALKDQGCPLDAKLASQLGRHARTYLCIPMGVDLDNPSVLACLDLVGPGEWIPHDVQEIAEILQEDFGVQIALLIDKRT